MPAKFKRALHQYLAVDIGMSLTNAAFALEELAKEQDGGLSDHIRSGLRAVSDDLQRLVLQADALRTALETIDAGDLKITFEGVSRVLFEIASLSEEVAAELAVEVSAADAQESA